MVKLVQQANFALGDENSIKKLAESPNPKILVVSDSHGKPWILKNILYNFGKGCDALFFCGDGMSDLISILEEAHLDSGLMDFIPGAIFFVHGNGDNSTIPLLTDERKLIQVPIEAKAVVSGKKIFMTHGHSYNVYFGTKDLALAGAKKGADIIFYGHTHLAAVQKKKIQEKEMIILNPGSCSLPRGGMPNSFALVSIGKDGVKTSHIAILNDDDGNILFQPFSAPAKNEGEMRFF